MNKEPKNKLVIQDICTEFTPALQKKIDNFHTLKSDLMRNLQEQNYSEEFVKNITFALDKADLTYSLCGEMLDKNNIPRNASMVCGPSYTSHKFPQPVDSDGNLMYPVIQIDMEWVGKLTNRKLLPELLQLWWSADASEDLLIFVPKSDMKTDEVSLLDFENTPSKFIGDWIPYNWICEDHEKAFVFTKCLPIGITYPDFEVLVDVDFQNENATGNKKNVFKLLQTLCIDQRFNTPKNIAKGLSLNIFGYYRSHSCSSWEVESTRGFLHTSGWASSSMDANILIELDSSGEIDHFDFSYGR